MNQWKSRKNYHPWVEKNIILVCGWHIQWEQKVEWKGIFAQGMRVLMCPCELWTKSPVTLLAFLQCCVTIFHGHQTLDSSLCMQTLQGYSKPLVSIKLHYCSLLFWDFLQLLGFNIYISPQAFQPIDISWSYSACACVQGWSKYTVSIATKFSS